MTISLTFPALSRKPEALKFWLQPLTQTFRSPLTGSVQTKELPGARWRASMQWSDLSQSDWRALTAFLAQCRGQAGRFYYTPPHAALPRGIATGTPLVNGAGQAGATLITDGWTASKTGILKTGDLISFDTSSGFREMHMVVADANSDGSGNATLTIEPPIRFSPADNAPITVNNPSCVMMLDADDVGALAVAPPVLGSVQIDMSEALFAS